VNFLQILFINSGRLQFGSIEHVLPIGLAILFCSVLIRFARKKLSTNQKHLVFKWLGIFVSLTIVLFHAHKISLGGYAISKDLPLFLCSFLALIIPVFTSYKKYWMYEILLFWIIAGTLQGVITPDIAEGFPSLDYFRYWIVHLGLLTIIFYATFVLHMRPKFKSVIKSFLALQVYVAAIMLINYVLNSNYFYLNRKPESASALDYLGDYPYYLLVVELILIPFFLLIYLPFYLTGKKKKLTSE